MALMNVYEKVGVFLKTNEIKIILKPEKWFMLLNISGWYYCICIQASVA